MFRGISLCSGAIAAAGAGELLLLVEVALASVDLKLACRERFVGLIRVVDRSRWTRFQVSYHVGKISYSKELEIPNYKLIILFSIKTWA